MAGRGDPMYGHWTRQRIIDAIQDFAAQYGYPPRAVDWNPPMARRPRQRQDAHRHLPLPMHRRARLAHLRRRRRTHGRIPRPATTRLVTTQHPTSAHPFHKDKRNTRDKTPRSPCPICLLPGASNCTTQLMQWRCPRGHEWTSTRLQAERHGDWVSRLYTGPPEVNQT